MISLNLADSTFLITGASRGLGAAIATRLHAAGANVVLNYFEEGGGVNRAAAESLAGNLGPRAWAVCADVRDRAAVEQMLLTTREHFGKLHGVINNAAILRDRSLRKMEEEDWTAVIDTNLTGVFHVCRAAVELLEEHGRIVNIASISAALGFYGQANYAAAKAGVVGLTRVLSREFAKRAITVNAVAPGVCLTEMGRSIPEPVREQMLSNIPLGRFAEPEEIADTVLFLCSPLASYITGQLLHVNGGWCG